MKESMSLLSNYTQRRDMWMFQKKTMLMHELDVQVGNQLQQSMQAIEDIAIMMVHPITIESIENLHLYAHEQVSLVCMDS